MEPEKIDIKNLLQDLKLLIGGFTEISGIKDPDHKSLLVINNKPLIDFQIMISPIIIKAKFVSQKMRTIAKFFMNESGGFHHAEIASLEHLNALLHNIKQSSGILSKKESLSIQLLESDFSTQFIQFTDYQKNMLDISLHNNKRILFNSQFNDRVFMVNEFFMSVCEDYEIYTHHFSIKVQNNSTAPIFQVLKKYFNGKRSRKPSVCYLILKESGKLPDISEMTFMIAEIQKLTENLKKLS